MLVDLPAMVKDPNFAAAEDSIFYALKEQQCAHAERLEVRGDLDLGLKAADRLMVRFAKKDISCGLSEQRPKKSQ